MEFHLHLGGGVCGVIYRGLSPPKPKPGYVPEAGGLKATPCGQSCGQGVKNLTERGTR